MGSSYVPGTSEIKHHTLCVKNSTEKTRVVATIFSETNTITDTNTCVHSSNPNAQSAGYWDLGNYSYCDNGIPKCQNGSYKVVSAMTPLDSSSRLKYHTWCVLPNQSSGTKFLATIYSHSSSGSKNTCILPGDPQAVSKGYWDISNFATCDSTGTPRCGLSSKQVLISSSWSSSGVAHHQACIHP